MARLPLWALALVPARLFGQNAASDVHSPAATYLERYQEISNLAPLPGRVAEVNHLVLSRDVGRLILERGTLYLLTPVGGRTVAALFRGEGRFGFAPDTPAERAELQRFSSSRTRPPNNSARWHSGGPKFRERSATTCTT